MRTNEGIIRVRRICKNAKLPIRGTTRVVGYDLVVVQTTPVPAHGKVLVKIGLTMALPLDCCYRIATRFAG